MKFLTLMLLLVSCKSRTTPVSETKYKDGLPFEDKNCALMIEGGCYTTDGIGCQMFPEVLKAEEFARTTACSTFDAIYSYEYEHLSAVILSLNEEDRKIFAAHILVAFGKDAPPEKIIDKLIKRVYLKLVGEQKLRSVPDWVSALNDRNDSNCFLQDLL